MYTCLDLQEGSGKSSIIRKVTNRDFNPHMFPTSSNHYQYRLDIGNLWNIINPQSTTTASSNLQNQPSQQHNNNFIIRFHIWDYGGCQSYRLMRQSAIKSKNYQNKVCLIVFDLFKNYSLKQVMNSINQWNTNVESQYKNCIIVIGNKIDLEKDNTAKVLTQQAIQLCRFYNLLYFQTSAKYELPIWIFEKSFYLRIAFEVNKNKLREREKDKKKNKTGGSAIQGPRTIEQEIEQIIIKHIEQIKEMLKRLRQQNSWLVELSNFEQKNKKPIQNESPTNPSTKKKQILHPETVWQQWQKKVKPILYSLLLFFSQQQSLIRKFHTQHLNKLGHYLLKSAQIDEIRKQVGFSNGILELMGDNKQSQFSNQFNQNFLNQLSKYQNDKQQKLQQQLQKNIQDEKNSIKTELFRFSQQFGKIFKKYQQSQVREFVAALEQMIAKQQTNQSNIGSESQGNSTLSNNTIVPTESSLIFNNSTKIESQKPSEIRSQTHSQLPMSQSPSVHIKQSLTSNQLNPQQKPKEQENSQSEHQQQRQSQMLLKNLKVFQMIREHYQILNNFKAVIKEMEHNMIEFYDMIKQEYLCISQTPNGHPETTPQPDLIELTSTLINFYTKKTYQQILGQPQSEIFNPHSQQNIQQKINILKQKYEGRLEELETKLRGIGSKLKKDIINGEDDRRRMKILANQVAVLQRLKNCSQVDFQTKGEKESNCRPF